MAMPPKDQFGEHIRPVRLFDGNGTPADGNVADNGYQRIPAPDLSSVRTLTVPANTVKAIVQCEGEDVRFLMNGNNPTASVGMLLPVGGMLEFSASEAAAVRFIEVDLGATLNIQYQRVA